MKNYLYGTKRFGVILMTLTLGIATVSFALPPDQLVVNSMPSRDFEAKNPFNQDLVRGYQMLLAKEGSSGVRGGGDAEKLAAVFNALGELQAYQESFWVVIGNINVERLSENAELRRKYLSLITMNRPALFAKKEFRILDQCSDAIGRRIDVALSDDTLHACVSAQTLIGEIDPANIFDSITHFSAKSEMSVEDFKNLARYSYGPFDAGSKIQEYRARFNLGVTTDQRPSDLSQCRLVSGDDSAQDHAWKTLKTEVSAIEFRQDFDGNWALHGENRQGVEIYAKCID